MAYLPLSTANLPDPVIDPAQGASPEDYFNTVLYTGNATVNHQITGVGFQPDFLWIKQRSGTEWHNVQDVVRGVQEGLFPNDTYQEVTRTNAVKSFDTDGFTLGDNSGSGWNTSGSTYVAWNWKANGSGVSNTDGSITSTVSANTTSGFSIVSYTGTGASATVGHGLGVTPDLLIIKNRGNTRNWAVWHSALGGDNLVTLNTSGAVLNNSVYWGGGNHTSTTFEVNTSTLNNENTYDHIAYCFHSVDGFSKFGSYTGNGSADGPFVYTGFRPAFVMVKRTDSTANWQIYDTARDLFNSAGLSLAPNGTAAESDGGEDLDILSNGFKARDTAGARNANGGTYIFMAFSDANGPFKYSNAR